MKEKVIVGMSGGVDSSVTALLLKEKGYDVTGVCLKLIGNENGIEDAKKVCESLGVGFDIIDNSSEFKKEVIDYFTEEYLSGRTPNPCCVCNRKIKFKALAEYADQNGAGFIATGHYAKVVMLDNGRYSIKNAEHAQKDQTYALYDLTQEQLARLLMPLGEYTKDTVRKIAQNTGLTVADKKDSQDICFIPDGDYASFLRRNVDPARMPGEGDFVLSDGRVIGKHTGYTDYTIGQRRGLNIAAGHRVFVSKICPETNKVVISHEDVYSDTLICDNMNMMAISRIEEPVYVFAKVRYAHRGEWGILKALNDGSFECVFDNEVRAITPGQAVVFYKDDYILCGGIIKGTG